MSAVRVAVAAGHHQARSGLVELLESDAEIEVLGSVSTGPAALELLREVRPDVLLLDAELPGPGAIAVVEQAAQISPLTRVIVRTAHDDATVVRSLLDAGAAGYLHSSAGRTELAAAIVAATRADGSVLLAMPQATAVELSRGPERDDGQDLSPREAEILVLVAQGKSNRAIGRALYISEATVKRHLANVNRKLGATSRMAAVRMAEANGMLPPSARLARRR